MELKNTINTQGPVLEWLINGENENAVPREVKYGKITIDQTKMEVTYKGNLRDFIKNILFLKRSDKYKHVHMSNHRVNMNTVMRDLYKYVHPNIVSITRKGNYLIIKTKEKFNGRVENNRRAPISKQD